MKKSLQKVRQTQTFKLQSHAVFWKNLHTQCTLALQLELEVQVDTDFSTLNALQFTGKLISSTLAHWRSHTDSGAPQLRAAGPGTRPPAGTLGPGRARLGPPAPGPAAHWLAHRAWQRLDLGAKLHLKLIVVPSAGPGRHAQSEFEIGLKRHSGMMRLFLENRIWQGNECLHIPSHLKMKWVPAYMRCLAWSEISFFLTGIEQSTSQNLPAMSTSVCAASLDDRME